eukprot:SAG11_NODE_1876_length_4137_cov_1.429916_4_plen_243_part_00
MISRWGASLHRVRTNSTCGALMICLTVCCKHPPCSWLGDFMLAISSYVATAVAHIVGAPWIHLDNFCPQTRHSAASLIMRTMDTPSPGETEITYTLLFLREIFLNPLSLPWKDPAGLDSEALAMKRDSLSVLEMDLQHEERRGAPPLSIIERRQLFTVVLDSSEADDAGSGRSMPAAAAAAAAAAEMSPHKRDFVEAQQRVQVRAVPAPNCNLRGNSVWTSVRAVNEKNSFHGEISIDTIRL